MESKKPKTGKIINCGTCGKPFYIPINRFNTAKFCSPKCRGDSARHQFSGVCKICGGKFSYISCREGKAKYCSRKCYHIGQKNKGTISLTCKQCGKIFQTSPSRERKRLYCSKNCVWEAKKKEFTVHLSSSTRRAMERRGLIEKCMECGYNEHPEILGIHHDDLNGKNHSFENLHVLCPNCHSLKHNKHTPH